MDKTATIFISMVKHASIYQPHAPLLPFGKTPYALPSMIHAVFIQ